MTAALKAFHADQAKRAAELYLTSRTPATEAAAWHLALDHATKQIKHALDASDFLSDVGAALQQDGRHMLVFRNLLAPPISQDQFRILCGSWPKSTEKTGAKLDPVRARAVAATFEAWRNKQLTPWLDRRTKPDEAQLTLLVTTVGTLIASQSFATELRNVIARDQEAAVTAMLDRKGWKRLPSRLVDMRAALPTKHYMHKTRFATRTARPQEVDIACGLKGTYVLAMECKVTNDETNSVKRVNDVLKKATAWKEHWGSFVETAALLQGVIASKDVDRLIDSGIHVFWSHDLQSFENWLDTRL